MRVVLFLAALGIALWILLRELAAEAGRRARIREAEVALKERERAADREHGGSPEDPILVPTPSVVEADAAAKRCPRCDIPMRIVEHVAESFGEQRLRVVRLTCPRCATVRAVYFRIGLPS